MVHDTDTETVKQMLTFEGQIENKLRYSSIFNIGI